MTTAAADKKPRGKNQPGIAVTLKGFIPVEKDDIEAQAELLATIVRGQRGDKAAAATVIQRMQIDTFTAGNVSRHIPAPQVGDAGTDSDTGQAQAGGQTGGNAGEAEGNGDAAEGDADLDAVANLRGVAEGDLLDHDAAGRVAP